MIAKCTSVWAHWCPVHGHCTCIPAMVIIGPRPYRLTDPRCPLHGIAAEHPSVPFHPAATEEP
jgi:hypothetical protein